MSMQASHNSYKGTYLITTHPEASMSLVFRAWVWVLQINIIIITIIIIVIIFMHVNNSSKSFRVTDFG